MKNTSVRLSISTDILYRSPASGGGIGGRSPASGGGIGGRSPASGGGIGG
jgi:hypothetical protein